MGRRNPHQGSRAAWRNSNHASNIMLPPYRRERAQNLAPYRIHPGAFEQQVRWLRRHGYYSVSIAQWAEAMQQNAPLPGRPVLFTFDDGYRDFAEVAWPTLDVMDFRRSSLSSPGGSAARAIETQIWASLRP
jgi:hypothetical protein